MWHSIYYTPPTATPFKCETAFLQRGLSWLPTLYQIQTPCNFFSIKQVSRRHLHSYLPQIHLYSLPDKFQVSNRSPVCFISLLYLGPSIVPDACWALKRFQIKGRMTMLPQRILKLSGNFPHRCSPRGYFGNVSEY